LEFFATLSWLGEERNRMKASKFSDAQKAFIIKQGDEGTPVAEICRKAGIHWPTGECAAIADRQPSDLLQLEEEVCRAAANRDEAVEAARGREQSVEEDRGRLDAGSGDVAGEGRQTNDPVDRW
jgi:hypothetical protein